MISTRVAVAFAPAVIPPAGGVKVTRTWSPALRSVMEAVPPPEAPLIDLANWVDDVVMNVMVPSGQLAVKVFSLAFRLVTRHVTFLASPEVVGRSWVCASAKAGRATARASQIGRASCRKECRPRWQP